MNARSERMAKPDDPSTWCSFGEALATAKAQDWDGVGFAFSADDPYAGIDLDKCRNPTTGELEGWARKIIKRLQSYTEVSPSGTGVKIFAKGKLPPGRRRKGKIEMYDDKRYFTVTGHHLPGTPTTIEDRQAELDELHASLSATVKASQSATSDEKQGSHGNTSGSPQPPALSLSDEEIIARARQALNGDKFDALWKGDTSTYDGDASRADLALCSMLAFWVGPDPERIDRIFRQSRLFRAKWDEKHFADGRTYGQGTVEAALEGTTEFYQGGSPVNLSKQDDEKALTDARKLVKGLGKRAKKDPGTAFQPEVLGALALLKRKELGLFVRVKADLKKSGVPLRDLERGIKQHAPRPTLRIVDPDERPELRTVGQDLPDAPMRNLIIPEPYFLRWNATGHNVTVKNSETGEKEEQERIFAYAPLLITGRLQNLDDGSEWWQLAWKRPKGWHYVVVDRGVALDSKRLIALASQGFPVAGDNMRDVIQYLHKFEAINYRRIPQAKVSSHLGWQGKGGKEGFLWGRALISMDGKMILPINLDQTSPDRWPQSSVVFRGLAEGDEQIADAYQASGDLAGWRRGVRLLSRYPRAQVALYASFVPPLLMMLDVPNFTVDFANRTTTGKTTVLRVGASVWGKPDELADDGALGTWDATRVWLERASSVLTGIPLILDDTKRAKEPRMVADLLYALASGHGRGRGNLQSLGRTRTWRTVLLSSGEAPATSFTQDGGTRTRCLEIRGMPFGGQDAERGELATRLTWWIQRHYGHAGPAFVRWVLNQRENWPLWKQQYHTLVESYAERVKTPEGGRLAKYVAAIDLTAQLVHEALQLLWPYRNPFDHLWEEIAAEAADASGEERALRHVVSWAHANAETFWGRHVTDGRGKPKVPGKEWAGRWDTGKNGKEWDWIAFYPHVVRQILKEQKYMPEEILFAWKEKGWLMIDQDGQRNTKRMRIRDDRPHLIVITRDAIEQLDV